MPTGYTAQIENGSVKTPKDFLRICLRNFGICSIIRDDDIPNGVTDFLPYIRKRFEEDIKYYGDQLAAAEKKLAEFDALSDEDLFKQWSAENNEKRQKYNEWYVDALRQNEEYDKFLNAIKKWEASEDFKRIKEFAINQIEISKDNNPAYWGNLADNVEEPTRENFNKNSVAIRAELRNKFQNDVDYNQEQLNKKKESLQTAISFYMRFEDDIKDICG